MMKGKRILVNGHAGQAPKRQGLRLDFRCTSFVEGMRSEKAHKGGAKQESKGKEQTRMWSWSKTDFGLIHRERALE